MPGPAIVQRSRYVDTTGVPFSGGPTGDVLAAIFLWGDQATSAFDPIFLWGDQDATGSDPILLWGDQR
jgi:hypothetical protein